MPNDPQAKRVYAWENQWADWNARSLSVSAVRKYVRWACDLYGLPYPTVKQHLPEHCAYSYSQGFRVSFIAEHCNCAIALHEVAHYIADWVFADSVQQHGPQWLAIYLYLLSESGQAPKIALFASARAKKLSWIPLWQISPKRLARLPKHRPSKRRSRPPSR